MKSSEQFWSRAVLWKLLEKFCAGQIANKIRLRIRTAKMAWAIHKVEPETMY